MRILLCVDTQVPENATVLIVEDDREIAELVSAYLSREGIAAAMAGSAEQAIVECAALMPDLLLLDLGLPGADGLEFLRHFRDRSTAPVIIVSARESDEDKIVALGLGADDFVTKPFSPKVLAARVKAQLRRASYTRDAASIIAPHILAGTSKTAFGPYLLDFEGKLLERDGGRVPLSRREFQLLAFLVANEGKTYSPEELYKSVWGLEHGDLSTVAVHVQRVRRKIEEEGAPPKWLVTVPGAGYRFMRRDAYPRDGAL